MSDVFAPLEQLPQTTRAFCAQTLRAAEITVEQSQRRMDREPLHRAAMWVVRRTQLDFRFLIARDGEDVLFFFVKRQLPSALALSAHLVVSMEAAPPVSPQTPSRDGRTAPTQGEAATRYRLRIPSFLWAKPDASARTKYAPPGTDERNGILFRVGSHAEWVLAIRDPEHPKKAALCFGPLGQSARPLPLRVADPFLRLTETLRDWLLGPTGSGDIHDLRFPENPSHQSDVHVTLHWFVESYLAMERESAAADSALSSRAMNRPRYQVSGYQAELQVCVDEQGQFANPQTPNPINIGLRLSLRRDRGWLTALIDLLPPDFLVDGALHASFLSALESLFRKEPHPIPQITDADGWSEFLSSARSHAVVFRTGKDGKQDREVFLLPGSCAGKKRTLLVRAMASVSWQKKDPHVALQKGEVCYDSLSASPDLLDEEVASYFLRLCSSLRDWIGRLS